MLTPSKTALCDRCQQPFKGSDRDWDREWPPGIVLVPPSHREGFQHHETWRDVEAAAQDGCYICSWIVRRKPSDFSNELSTTIYYLTDSVTVRAVSNDGHSFEEGFVIKSRIEHIVATQTPPQMSLDLQQLRSLILPWHKRCRDHHTACTRQQKTFCPSRLLHIGSSLVQLVEAESLRCLPKYCTVSHCWGNNKLPTLTACSWNRLRTGMAISELPLGHQEAVMAAQALDIGYIWIDSLCIMQDSTYDWQKEAGTMSSVYRGAEVNIALSAASDSERPSLSGRDTSLIRPASVRTSYQELVDGFWRPREDVCHYTLYIKDIHKQDLESSRLLHRAWVVQEMKLAPRVLVLGREQLWYLCMEDAACETFPQGTASILSGGDPHMLKYVYNPYRLVKGPLDADLTYEAWADLVEQYSRCGLTVPSDILIALGGLAQSYAEQLDDEYTAGMWRSQLPRQLLWRVETPGSRPPQYRAPTWAWSSVQGHISYSDGSSGSWNPAVCELISVAVKLSDESNPFGHITNASIVLHGCLVPITILESHELKFLDGTINGFTLRTEYSLDVMGHAWQTEENDAEVQVLCKDRDNPGALAAYALPICRFEVGYDGYACRGLILQEVEHSNNFVRIGTFDLRDKGHEPAGKRSRDSFPVRIPRSNAIDLLLHAERRDIFIV